MNLFDIEANSMDEAVAKLHKIILDQFSHHDWRLESATVYEVNSSIICGPWIPSG
jgi:hypothetical protein